MSLKIESPRPQQVFRPAVTSQVSPGFARGEPAPSAAPRLSDGFERMSAGTSTKLPGGSRFEGVGSALRPLPKRLESSRTLADNVVKFFSQDSKLQELGRSDPSKARQILQASFQAGGLSARDARILTQRYAAPQLEGSLGKAGNGSISDKVLSDLRSTDGATTSTDATAQLAGIKTAGGSRPTDGVSDLSRDAVMQFLGGADFSQFKNWGDAQKFANELLDKVPLQDGESKDALKAFIDLKIGEKLVADGIDLNGKNLGGKIGSGKDAFEGLPQGGFAPGEPLEDLPQQLEPHRGALEKLTDSLLRDSKLDNDATLRKALWSELKKLPIQDDAVRHDARQYLLEEFSLRQDRFTE